MFVTLADAKRETMGSSYEGTFKYYDKSNMEVYRELQGFVRISLGTSDQNDLLIENMAH